jgi:hypothetical protein
MKIDCKTEGGKRVERERERPIYAYREKYIKQKGTTERKR